MQIHCGTEIFPINMELFVSIEMEHEILVLCDKNWMTTYHGHPLSPLCYSSMWFTSVLTAKKKITQTKIISAMCIS